MPASTSGESESESDDDEPSIAEERQLDGPRETTNGFEHRPQHSLTVQEAVEQMDVDTRKDAARNPEEFANNDAESEEEDSAKSGRDAEQEQVPQIQQETVAKGHSPEAARVSPDHCRGNNHQNPISSTSIARSRLAVEEIRPSASPEFTCEVILTDSDMIDHFRKKSAADVEQAILHALYATAMMELKDLPDWKHNLITAAKQRENGNLQVTVIVVECLQSFLKHRSWRSILFSDAIKESRSYGVVVDVQASEEVLWNMDEDQLVDLRRENEERLSLPNDREKCQCWSLDRIPYGRGFSKVLLRFKSAQLANEAIKIGLQRHGRVYPCHRFVAEWEMQPCHSFQTCGLDSSRNQLERRCYRCEGGHISSECRSHHDLCTVCRLDRLDSAGQKIIPMNRRKRRACILRALPYWPVQEGERVGRVDGKGATRPCQLGRILYSRSRSVVQILDPQKTRRTQPTKLIQLIWP